MKMTFEIPDSISSEEWSKLPDKQKPIFRQSKEDPGKYEYAVPQFHNSMVNAKQERDAVKAALSDAESQLGIYKKFGDPQKIADLLQREDLIMDQTRTMEDKIRQANEDARKREAENVKRLADERDFYKNGMTDYAKRTRVEAMVEASGIDPDYKEEAINAAMRAIQSEIRDGMPVLTVMDGENIARDPDTGDPMTPERWFQQYRTKKAKLFKGDAKGEGPGFPPGRGQQGSLYDKDPLEWTFEEKKQFQKETGVRFQSEYAKLLQLWNGKRSKDKR